MKKNTYYILIFLFLLIPKLIYASCVKPTMPSNDEWNLWLESISNEAKSYGISPDIINRELSDLIPIEKIILRDRCQPESTITFKEYVYYRLDKTRIYKGKINKEKFKLELKQISKEYNIQEDIILAIWGMESYYGKNQGKNKIIPALATLSFDKKRSSFYKKQLFAALEILEKNYISSKELIGSWAGAMGQAQFLPTTYLDSAVDFNNDGIKDIWNTEVDVFSSIANYLTSIDKVPWNNDLSWGFEVLPPNNINDIYNSLKQKNPKGCYAVKTMSVEKTLNEWSELGFKKLNNSNLSSFDIQARLVAPDKLKGRMFLVYSNYKPILYYNCSHYYALTIGLLSDAISK